MLQRFFEWFYSNNDTSTKIAIIILVSLVIVGVLFLIINVVINVVRAIRSLYLHHVTKINKKVARISNNISHLKMINSKYGFTRLNNYHRRIIAPVRSLQKYRTTSGEDVLQYYIEQDIDSIRSDVDMAIKTAARYKEYLREVGALEFNTDKALLEQEKISGRKFRRYEQKLLRRMTVKDPTSVTVTVKICYSSPRGRNSYEKNEKGDYNDLVYIYNLWRKKRDYRLSAKYERSLMSASLRYDVLKRDNYRCCICGASRNDGAKLHVDHITPVSKGGKTTMSNLQTLCEQCNLGKSNKL